MKASMALVATSTRVEEFPRGDLSAEDAIESGPHGSRAQLLSASTRLAVGLGLKGVLPCAGWAGLTDSPRRKLLSVAGPPFPLKSGIERQIDSTGALHTSATWNLKEGGEGTSTVRFRRQTASEVPAKVCRELRLFSGLATPVPVLRAPPRQYDNGELPRIWDQRLSQATAGAADQGPDFAAGAYAVPNNIRVTPRSEAGFPLPVEA